jgi:hypothetical protein
LELPARRTSSRSFGHCASAASQKRNPYYGWDAKCLNEFLYTLAKIAGRGNKVPIAGMIRTEVFHKIRDQLKVENPDHIEMGNDPFKFSMGQFFQVYHHETWLRWGNFRAPVTFCFDQSYDPKWTGALREVYAAFASNDSRMTQKIVFADKKQMPNLPLQAADMLAYRLRQNADKLDDGTYNISHLDKFLLKGLLRSSHQ